MEIDLAEYPARAPAFRSQVCIVGAGIAGLTLAQRLNGKGITVALLEAGGPTITFAAQNEVAEAQLSGTPHLGTTEGRFRVLGGSGLSWGGQLLPLPELNALASRALASAQSGPRPTGSPGRWPIDPATLASRYRDAERLLGVDDLPYPAHGFFRRAHLTRPALFGDLPELDAQYSKWTPFSRRNLAASIGTALLSSPTTTVYLHAQATELQLRSSGTQMAAVLVRTRSGQVFRFEAEHFVVAAGTVETVRLLLASRSMAAKGVGNAHDQVGRNFHDHLTLPVAQVTGPARARLLEELGPWVLPGGETGEEAGGTLHSAKLIASTQLCERLELNPVLAHLTVEEPPGSGLAAVRELLHASQQGDLRSALANHAAQLPRAALEAFRLAWAAEVHHRRFISAGAAVTLRLNAAQDAPSLSRIMLGEGYDAGGMPQVRVDWKISAQEIATLRRFALHLQQRMAGLELEGLHWLPELHEPDAPLHGIEDARHAMGGACMGLDPRSSVVSPDLGVHGVANLWIASAATFPTGASQLPTLPLMALSLRLADRLSAMLPR